MREPHRAHPAYGKTTNDAIGGDRLGRRGRLVCAVTPRTISGIDLRNRLEESAARWRAGRKQQPTEPGAERVMFRRQLVDPTRALVFFQFEGLIEQQVERGP